MNDHSYKRNELFNELQPHSNQISELEKRHREAEDALNFIVKRNQTLGESIPLGIFTIDRQGKVTGSNSKMNKFLHWPPVDMLKSKSVFKNSTLLDDKVVDQLRRCFKRKKPIVTECSHLYKKGDSGM